MIRTLLKAVAYSKAPRTTFAVLHPTGAVRLKKFAWDMRHAPAPRVSALGAAALALDYEMDGQQDNSMEALQIADWPDIHPRDSIHGWRGH